MEPLTAPIGISPDGPASVHTLLENRYTVRGCRRYYLLNLCDPSKKYASLNIRSSPGAIAAELSPRTTLRRGLNSASPYRKPTFSVALSRCCGVQGNTSVESLQGG